MILTLVYSINLIVGDFNVDFDRGGSLAELLVEFMFEMNLSACDLSFRQYVNFAYKRDDGASQSYRLVILYAQNLFLLSVRCLYPAHWLQPI